MKYDEPLSNVAFNGFILRPCSKANQSAEHLAKVEGWKRQFLEAINRVRRAFTLLAFFQLSAAA